jgi:hypothetical protein
VVCHQLGFSRNGLQEPRFEELRNLPMVLLTGAVEQGRVGRVLDEGMLKDVARSRWPSALIEQFCVH